MKILKEISETQDLGISLLKDKINLGFVPTMGALHEGHFSLVKQSIGENHKTIVSIFVNPTQFSPNEDLDKYPRTLDQDIEGLEKLGVDYLFFPSNKIMYPENYNTYVNVENITNYLCGKSRPNHFRGVATIVTKLFNIIYPYKAYFGQKDYQQCLVIKSLLKDLNLYYPKEIIICPIVRENDGLAMSSRNTYLKGQERNDALVLYNSLQKAKELIDKGIYEAIKIKEAMKDIIENAKSSKIDYISICDRNNLIEKEKIEVNKTLIALAVFIGQTRLIDNILI